MARKLTVTVQGTLGLDDGRRLVDDLSRTTGLEWRLTSNADGDHLSGGIEEIILTAVAGKTAELAYNAIVEKTRDRIQQWRLEHLEKPHYTLADAPLPEDAEDAEDTEDAGTAEAGAAKEPAEDPEPEN